MKWERVSPYSIQSGIWKIAKYGTKEGFRYEVWKGKQQMEVGFMSAEEAKRWIDENRT